MGKKKVISERKKIYLRRKNQDKFSYRSAKAKSNSRVSDMSQKWFFQCKHWRGKKMSKFVSGYFQTKKNPATTKLLGGGAGKG